MGPGLIRSRSTRALIEAAVPVLLCGLVPALVLGPWGAARLEGESLKGAIAGKVIDEANAPVPGVTVVLATGEWGHKHSETKTDSSGSFSFRDLEPVPFFVSFHPPKETDLVGDGYSTQPMMVSPTQRVIAGKVVRIERKLAQGGRIEATVQTSAPRCPCRLSVSSLVASYDVQPEIRERSLIFHGVPAGTDYILRFEADGYGTQRKTAITVRPRQATQVSFDYDPGSPTGISGTLRMPDGSPLGRYTVYLRREGETIADADSGRARTDESGGFSIVGLPPGVYLLDVEGVTLGRAIVADGSKSLVALVWGRPVAGLEPREGLPRVAYNVLDSSVAVRLLALAVSPPPGPPPPPWPWPQEPNLFRRAPDDDGSCRKVVPLARDEPLYRTVRPGLIEGIKTGLECLRTKAPRRHERMREKLEGTGGFFFGGPPALNFVFECLHPTGCSGTPSQRANTIWFVPATVRGTCNGCFPSAVFHEMLHLTSTSAAECITYRCAKECFACAAPVLDEIENEASGKKEDCRPCLSCTDLD
jgi:hypothetical protein